VIDSSFVNQAIIDNILSRQIKQKALVLLDCPYMLRLAKTVT